MPSPSILVREGRADDGVAARLLADYGAELAARGGRPFSPLDPPEEIDGTLRLEAHELAPPGGCFLVIEEEGAAVACGGLRTLAPGIGEIKRMYVAPGARRRGHARRLLAALEERARALGHARVRLDTNAVQPEAVALYHAAGYAEIGDYNGSPTATHWFQKEL